MKIVGLCGSLRKKSLNGFALAKAAASGGPRMF